MLGRRHIVASRLGRLAIIARSKLEYWRTSPETIGTLANDQMAELLVTRLPERSFVDVGAHIGSIISAVQAHCPGVKITAIEPIPDKVKHLRAAFPGVDVIECGVSDREGQARFFIDSQASGYSSLADGPGKFEIEVALKRLDCVVSDPDLVKIDVEGAELGVLRGAEGLKSRPVYMFESAPADVLGYTKPDLWRWFDDHDYGIFAPNRLAHTAPPMTLDVFIDSHEFPRRTTNYFGIPREKFEAVRARARRILNL